MIYRSAIFLLLVFHGLDTRAQWQSIGTVDSIVTAVDGECTLQAGDAIVHVRALAPNLIRVRCFPPSMHAHLQSIPPLHSWAVNKDDWDPVRTTVTIASHTVSLTTQEIRVEIQRAPLRIRFFDRADNAFCADHPSKGMSWANQLESRGSGSEVRVWKVMPENEYYYGFGERAGKFMRKYTHMTNWNSDIPAYTADTDPLYKSIPFFYGMREGKAYGVFFDNTAWSSLDMGKESRDQYSFGAESGELTYYFFFGPEPSTVLHRYTELVGRMPLPPLWSLGYQQCRWSYAPESRVREIAREFRSRAIPCDVLYLDIDYMDDYRVFTWSPTNFPNPDRLIADLAKEGFKTAVIIDPGIKVDSSYRAYQTGLAGSHFLTNRDGSVFVGDVWPGRCAFPDFTSRAARTWWGDQFAGLVRSGVKGWWNDMNEPSVFNTASKTIDLSVVHDDDGRFTTHARSHNIYGMEMTRATYEGVRKLNPDERPFILTRATYAGGQRYAAVWTGDNVASWDHLRMALSMCLNLSISGEPFVGSDIGGFIGYPSGELFARWLQLGAFTPLMRAHSVINEKNKEPWEYGESYTAMNRGTINLRYQLLPYVYTTMAEAAEQGIPAMRPMVFAFPDDHRFLTDDSQFLFGPNLLVAPVLWEGSRSRDVTLPQGVWYDFWTDLPSAGGTRVKVDAPVSRIPCFVRAGSVLPMQRNQQFVGDGRIDTLILNVYPAGSSPTTTSSLYQDDGSSFAYAQGVYARRTFTVTGTATGQTCEMSRTEGTYQPSARVLHFRFLHTVAPPRQVLVNGTDINHLELKRSGSVIAGWTYSPEVRRTDLFMDNLPIARRIELIYDH